MRILLTLFVFVCPLFFIFGESIRDAQELFYQLGGTALVSALLLFKSKKNIISIIIGTFAIYNVALFMLGGFRFGNAAVMNIFMGTLLYYCTLQLKREHTKLILYTIVYVCILNIFYIALQNLNFDFIFNIRGPNNTILYNTKESIGFFGLKSAMGMYMGLGMIITFLINPLISVLFLIPLWLSKSTGVICSAILVSLFYFWWVKRKVCFVIAPLLVICGLIYIFKVDAPMGMYKTRPPMWKIALHDAMQGFDLKEKRLQSPYLKNPILGFGVDAFSGGNIFYYFIPETNETIRAVRTPQGIFDMKGVQLKQGKDTIHIVTTDGKKIDRWDNPHCFLVEVIYNYGFLGLTLFGFFLFWLGKIFYESVKTKELLVITSMILFLLGCSFTQFPFGILRVGYLAPILLALFVNESRLYEEDKNIIR